MRVERDFWKRNGALLAFVITAAYFAAVADGIGFSYAINDDINMRDIASGAYTGTPDGHLIFMLYPLGWMLKSLYQLWPGPEWYGLVMVGCHLLSVWVMLTGLYRRIPDINWKKMLELTAAFLLLYTILWLPQAVRIQFSTCAASLGAGALFRYGIGPRGDEGRTFFEDGVTAVLAALCLCVRFEVFCIAGAFALLLFLWKEGKTGLKKGMRLPVLTAILCLAVFLADRQAYASAEWQRYLEYNQARSNVYDYYEVPGYEENQDLYGELGLSRDTVQAIADANMLADDSVNQETFRRLEEAAGSRYRQEHSAGQRFREGLRLVGEQFSFSTYGYLAGGGVFLWLLFLWLPIFGKTARESGEKRNRLLFWSGAVLLQAALWLYLGYEGRLPERVGYCLHLCSFTAALVLCGMEWERRRFEGVLSGDDCHEKERSGDSCQKNGCRENGYQGSRRFLWDRALFFGIAFLLAWGSFGQCISEAEGRRDAQDMAELIRDYCQSRSDNFYFADVYSLSAHTGRVDLLSARHRGQEANMMRMGDWTAFSPLAEEKLRSHGIDSVPESLVKDDHVFLITRDDNPMDYLKRLCVDRFGQVTWHVEDVLSCGEFHMYVYRFHVQGERMLDYRSFEKVQASVNPVEGRQAADGDSSTRWNSGEAQRAGMAVDIVLDQVYQVTGFRLDLFFYEDHPRRLKIYTSEDGENWTEGQAESAGQVEFTFSAPVSCKNIRLVLEEPEEDEGWNWSIYEILVFAREGS